MIDNSVWSRLSTSPEVVDAFRSLVDTARPPEVFICPPVAAEYGYSSRTGGDHSVLMRQLAAFTDCPTAPSTHDVLTIQNALWNGGLLRGVGATDVLIAAYGIANDAAVVHYDYDFEHVARVAPLFRHHWIVPRGAL